MSEAGPLQGRVAIVTGASAGIGRATAVALADAGATVVVTARRAERLRRLREEIEGAGGTALAVACDVTRKDEVDGVVSETLSTFDKVDILVNNAGVMTISPVSELRLDDWKRMVDVNVHGVLNFLHAVLPSMLERRSGHLVSVGSVAGRRPFPGASVYSATKFAMRALSWGMHLELGGAHGIRVTDIQPGLVETELLDGDPELKATWAAAWEGRRTLDPEDVARTVVFAATSPEHVSISEILVRPKDQPT